MEPDSRSTWISSGGIGSGSVSNGAEDPYHSQASTFEGKRKAGMTAEERTNYERERNRVHARNTRARKKQYMEGLKERVENMHAQKAAVERLREDAEKAEDAQVAKWEGTLTKVMDLRCEGVTEEDKWKELLSESFRFTLPLTPYRPYDPADIVEHRRVLLGMEGMVSDVSSLKAMCTDMARKCRAKAGVPTKTKGGAGAEGEDRVHLKCFLGTGDFLFSGPDGIMSMLSMRTIDARRYGSALEVEASGMLRARFAEDGKLEELDMMFDGVAVHQQIQKATGSNPAKQSTQAAEAADSAERMEDKDTTHGMAPPLVVKKVNCTENVPPMATAATTSPAPVADGAEASAGPASVSAGAGEVEGSE